MKSLKHVLSRYELPAFVLLSYLLSWAFVIPARGGLLPHGPTIAAFIILALVAGRPGVARLWQQMARWRVGWKWFWIAPGVFVAINLGALAIHLATGAPIVNTTHLRASAYLGAAIPLLFLGGQWEEPGWTGYLLKRFEARFPSAPLAAALATGAIRLVWHTPLLVFGTVPWFDYLFYSLALQIILTWLYHRTQGSVLIVMIGHLCSNLMNVAMNPLFAEPRGYWAVMVAVASAVALGLVIATRGRLGMQVEGVSTPALPTDVSVRG